MRLLLAAALLASGVSATATIFESGDPATIDAPVLKPAQSQFILRCGGCHGTLGVSPPRSVPMLRGSAGWFLCTPAGRDYIVRLPNVSKASLNDARLADVLNFVAFDLGGTSAPAGAPPFTADEVKAIRARPLNDVPLIAYRTKVVNEMIRKCGAPRDLLTYGSPVQPAGKS